MTDSYNDAMRRLHDWMSAPSEERARGMGVLSCDRLAADLAIVLDDDKRTACVVQAILTDVTDRRGWRQEWDAFDDDVREEIVAKWHRVVRAVLRGGAP